MLVIKYQTKLNRTIFLSLAAFIGLAIFSILPTQIGLAYNEGSPVSGAPIAPAFFDAGFDPVIGGSNGQIVRSFIQADGKTVIVGAFSVLNGGNKNSIARFNADGTLDTAFNTGAGPNDLVFTVAQQADGKLIIAGLLTAYNGTPVGRIARLNPDGSLDPTFNSVGLGVNPTQGANNQIGDVKVLPDGKIVIGGIFTSYNGIAQNRLARLNPDGSLDNTFQVGTGASGEVIAIAPQPDGKILIGGNFQNYNGTISPRLARVKADGGFDSSFIVATGADQAIRSITVQPDGKIVISGFLTVFGGFPANGIRRLNTDGSVDQTFNVAGIDAVVIAVALQADGKMILGGSFTQIASATRQCLVRVNADGTNDPTFDPGSSIGGAQVVNDIKLLADGRAVVNGTFSTYRGTPNGGAIRIHSDGTLDANLAVHSAMVGNFNTLSPQTDGKTIVGGTFSSVSGTPRANVARLNADGSNDTTFNPGTGANSSVLASAVQPDGKIILGGNFTAFNSTTANRIVRLNADGSVDTNFNTGTGMNASVESMLLLADGKILVGGGFATFNGTTVNRLVRLNSDGSLDTSFNTGTSSNGTVRQIMLQPDGKILIGGSFTTYNAVNRARIARLNSDGTLDTTFDPGTGPNNTINSFAPQPDGSIVIGGTFTSVSGVAKAKLAKLNPNGSLDTNFDIAGTGPGPGTGPAVTKVLAVAGGKTLVAGNFSTFNGLARNRLIRVHANGTIDHTFLNGQGAHAAPALTIGSLVRQPDGQILIGGQFTILNTSARSGLARFKNATDTFADLDGDGITDYSIMRRPGPIGQWTWWVNYSSSNAVSVFNFGLSPYDMPQPYDFDGDGKDDVAVWRNNPSGGGYYIIQSSTNTMKIVPFGLPGDVPVTEDYDGDGKDDLSVWRAPSADSGVGQATWYYLGSLNNPNNNITYVPFGMRYGTQSDQVDEPYPGDFDGDGRADFRIQRRVDTSQTTLSTPAIFYTMTATGAISYDYFGLAGDRIVPGDYDGDGRTDIAVARGFNVTPGHTTWYIRYSSGRPDEAIQWGAGGIDLFAQGDYDGDGITDLGIYRRAGEYNFYIRRSSDGAMVVNHFGASNNDIPVVNYHNR